ncbi:hypothetical protein [Lacipirellula parvula]|uniref:Alternative complex III subunit ActF n=1 Tax=Lacipirellula parvula TaxID=2650471 RepID=A0A5K7XDK3_9BACT|nr:hypothetical protein [Lacipirellula parvula]BBO34894.1 alternative complex III subunit ActF [Lacipirellula parvula]
MTAASNPPSAARSPLQFAAGAIVVGAIVGAIGWTQNHDQFFASYLVAWLFWNGLALGSMALQLLHNLTGGKWGDRIRPYLRATTGMIPIMAILFIPIAMNLDKIYEWANLAIVKDDSMLQYKANFYLNQKFFLIRAAIYFTLWFLLIGLLSWQARTNAAPDSPAHHRFRRFSGVGLGLHGLAVTFSSIDWMMSLEPHWFSAIYGVIMFAAQGVGALALSIFLATRDARRQPSLTPYEVDQFHDLGKLLSGLIMFWMYVNFSQLFIIWYGNLPEEVVWVIRRLAHGWLWVAVSLLVFHWMVPFFGLLNRDWKRDPARLGFMALMIVVMEWVMYVWYVEPAAQAYFEHLAHLAHDAGHAAAEAAHEGAHDAAKTEHHGFFPWIDAGLTVAIGGVWWLVFNRRRPKTFAQAEAAASKQKKKKGGHH